MFKTAVGPVEDGESFAYLRPETAQHIFTNFKNVVDSTSKQLPFGIAQIGKAFRNEITPRNFVFRVREFEQMELEFFVAPGTDEQWHESWVEARIKWWDEQGVSKNNLELYHVPEKELAHYSKATVDIMYKFPHGLEELEGIANRTDFDLGSHSKNQAELEIQSSVLENNESNARLATQDQETKKWTVPYVIEPSAGVDRGVLAVLNEAYKVEELDDGKTRTVLNLKPHLAPIKAAVIPLKKNHQGLVGLKVGIPSFKASAATEDASLPLPLFDLLSGWLITPTISNPAFAIEFNIFADDFGEPANKIFILSISSVKFSKILLFRGFLPNSVSFERGKIVNH